MEESGPHNDTKLVYFNPLAMLPKLLDLRLQYFAQTVENHHSEMILVFDANNKIWHLDG